MDYFRDSKPSIPMKRRIEKKAGQDLKRLTEYRRRRNLLTKVTRTLRMQSQLTTFDHISIKYIWGPHANHMGPHVDNT